MAEWVDELTLVSVTEPDERVNSNGFAGERKQAYCFLQYEISRL